MIVAEFFSHVLRRGITVFGIFADRFVDNFLDDIRSLRIEFFDVREFLFDLHHGDLDLTVSVERNSSGDQFKEGDSHRIDIAANRRWTAICNFRSDVVDRSDNDLRAGDVGSVLECGDAEVSKLDCAITCQEDVLWLQ